MTRLSRWHRISALAALLFQFAMVAVVPRADAELESAEPHVVHIDAGEQAPCPPGHDPAHCQFCRVLASQIDVVHGGFSLPGAFQNADTGSPGSTGVVAAHALFASPTPRGPPQA